MLEDCCRDFIANPDCTRALQDKMRFINQTMFPPQLKFPMLGAENFSQYFQGIKISRKNLDYLF